MGEALPPNVTKNGVYFFAEDMRKSALVSFHNIITTTMYVN